MENKTIEQMIKEANDSVKNAKPMTEEEEIEYDAEYGYDDNDDD